MIRSDPRNWQFGNGNLRRRVRAAIMFYDILGAEWPLFTDSDFRAQTAECDCDAHGWGSTRNVTRTVFPAARRRNGRMPYNTAKPLTLDRHHLNLTHRMSRRRMCATPLNSCAMMRIDRLPSLHWHALMNVQRARAQNVEDSMVVIK